MCLAVPGRVLEIQDTLAKVDFGHGTIRDVDISLVDVAIGQYILVHTGYAIQVMDEKEAKASLDLWRDILDRLKEE
jgi:hydrogenase expression/formation protein HypC